MAEYTYGKDFAIRTETDCIATDDDFGQYVGRITAVKIKTNADRIRSMTDEELMQFCVGLKTYEGCPNHGLIDCQESCGNCWLDWLRKEAG